MEKKKIAKKTNVKKTPPQEISGGGKGKINEHPKANTNGFDKMPQNINRKGRPNNTLKSLYNELLDSDGVIWLNSGFTGTVKAFRSFVSLSNLKYRIEKIDVVIDGKKIQKDIFKIGIPIAKRQALVLKLDKLIMQGNQATSERLIRFLWEQESGRAPMKIETNLPADGQIVINVRGLSKEKK